MSHLEHRARGPRVVRCFVVTVSDTRTMETDTSGLAIVERLTLAGHVVVGRALVADDPGEIRALVEREIATGDVQAVITTGGTGITSRDGTIEALRGLFEKELEGFGELFRMLSYQEIGPAAMLSRATAGLVRRRVVIALPGSVAAVTLAMERLLLPELGHLVEQAER